MQLSKKLVIGLLVSSITLSEAMAASTCAADFKSAQEDLDKTNDMLQNAATHVCGRESKDKCVEAISEVSKEMSEAASELQDTLDECDTKGSCHDDLAMVADNFNAASVDLSQAADACAKNSEPACGQDLMKAGNELFQSNKEMKKGAMDCFKKLAASTCAADFQSAKEDLAKTNEMLQNAATHVCGREGKDKCVEAISEVSKELSDTVDDV